MRKINPKELVRTVALSLMLLVACGYIFFNARNDWYADTMLLVLVFLCLPRLALVDYGKKIFIKGGIWILCGYLGLALISVLSPPSIYISHSWLIRSFSRIICVFIIVQTILPLGRYDRLALQYIIPLLCLMLSLAIISKQFDFLSKDIISFLTPWKIVDGAGHNKYVSFCLLFLMWGAVAVLWKTGRIQSLIAIVVVFISFCALLVSSSESSQLAAFISLVFFLLGHIYIRKWRYGIYLLCFLFFLIIPILWVKFSPVMSRNAWDVFQDSSSFLQNHWDIGSRLYLYDFCAGLVRKEFLFGYGFGSSLSIPVPDGVLPGWSMLPGGHPHNIVFLFLIEHGIVGFLWFTAVILMLFNYLYKTTLNCTEGPAVWALAISGQVVFSLSFSIWHPDVVLIYGLFFVFILITANFSES